MPLPVTTLFYLRSGRQCSARLSASSHLICTRVKKNTNTGKLSPQAIEFQESIKQSALTYPFVG